MNDTQAILHIKTGGTITGCVPEYPEVERLSRHLAVRGGLASYLTEVVQLQGVYSEIEICYKDSRDIDLQDRQKIVETINKNYHAGTRKYLITHGTFTMPETAVYIQDNLDQGILDQVIIVLTGSMYPWIMNSSDAPFNLGTAIGILNQSGISGVYIAMHGKIFLPGQVTKDVDRLVFEDRK